MTGQSGGRQDPAGDGVGGGDQDRSDDSGERDARPGGPPPAGRGGDGEAEDRGQDHHEVGAEPPGAGRDELRRVEQAEVGADLDVVDRAEGGAGEGEQPHPRRRERTAGGDGAPRQCGDAEQQADHEAGAGGEPDGRLRPEVDRRAGHQYRQPDQGEGGQRAESGADRRGDPQPEPHGRRQSTEPPAAGIAGVGRDPAGEEALADRGTAEDADGEDERDPRQQVPPGAGVDESVSPVDHADPAADAHLRGGDQRGRENGVADEFEPGPGSHAG